jgi:putative restriction endonuclease
MPVLSKPELLQEVLRAIREGGWLPLVVESAHPFLLRVSNSQDSWLDMRVYIWNCTHGGGGRSADEFRIQMTSTPTVDSEAARTLLLGWHDDKRVFAAWDIEAHDGQASSSPSAQVNERTLDSASSRAFGVQHKGNETVVAMRPAFLIQYALASASLHATGVAEADTALLNDLPTLTDPAIDAVASQERRRVIRTISTLYRASEFRERVLDAYGHRCAFCRVQLSLLDAAHIIPVAASGSTDEVVNGIALCKIHHFAFDTNLVSFDSNYEIEVSAARLAELEGLHGGLPAFRTALGRRLTLPAQITDHPRPDYIRTSRRIRGWRG